eukprot:CAMPEP_0113542706 /NCGR_PEP_ID=MMETSP0015_2-20120614/9758_1 /TAXON_ID=2838 /ORGANISM="Odontella" /LENGTH=400 /DNA_ID=CAMNT_0000442797 /DNA_START=116 /DNA_END=1318 /DNA_ORIENTATION=+ /assembly_acc=CAM_ASM_000160
MMDFIQKSLLLCWLLSAVTEGVTDRRKQRRFIVSEEPDQLHEESAFDLLLESTDYFSMSIPVRTKSPVTSRPSPPPTPKIDPTSSPSPQQSFFTPAPTPEGSGRCLPPPDIADPVSCVPTTGPCIADATTLKNVTDEMTDDDTVAICGNVATSETIRIAASRATLCCGGGDCVLGSAIPPGHQILFVSGRDFTLSGIRFRGGIGNRGGHVAIEADGDHLVEDCGFDFGRARQNDNFGGYGGNVFVQTRDSLTVRRSRFVRGEASAWGGGLAVFDAASLRIEDSLFEDNRASIGAGLMTHWDVEPDGQDISIFNTKFVRNLGEGFLATNLGALPSLRVWESTFIDNANSGISICCQDKDTYDAILCENQGTDGDNRCSSIQIYGETSGTWCLFFDENHPSY